MGCCLGHNTASVYPTEQPPTNSTNPKAPTNTPSTTPRSKGRPEEQNSKDVNNDINSAQRTQNKTEEKIEHKQEQNSAPPIEICKPPEENKGDVSPAQLSPSGAFLVADNSNSCANATNSPGSSAPSSPTTVPLSPLTPNISPSPSPPGKDPANPLSFSSQESSQLSPARSEEDKDNFTPCKLIGSVYS